MIGVVVSEPDSASVHIGERLLELAPFERRKDPERETGEGGWHYHHLDPEGVTAALEDIGHGQTRPDSPDDAPQAISVRRFATRHLDTAGIAEAFADPSLVVFASRHAGETGPLLTAHFTGNLGPADYGGRDRSLARAAPLAHDRLLDRFAANAPEGYEVGTECTHHGPTDVGVPSLFAELGSGESQWADPAGAAAVAGSILELAAIWSPAAAAAARTVAGFGGGHYAHRFDRLRRETGWSLGHVAADWGLEAMGDPADSADVLEQVFAASGTDVALVDGDRPALEAALDALGYRVVSETWLRETDGVPRTLVEAVEDRLAPVDSGVRFGEPARGKTDDGAGIELESLEPTSLPDDLLDGARAVDDGATRAAVERSLVAFETVEGASRAAGRALVPGTSAVEGLVSDLLSILERRYGAVAIRDGAVVATERAFDPAAARERGVPEGPAFGRLADGDPVEVDGETVDPAEVATERTRRFPLPESLQDELPGSLTDG